MPQDTPARLKVKKELTLRAFTIKIFFAEKQYPPSNALKRFNPEFYNNNKLFVTQTLRPHVDERCEPTIEQFEQLIEGWPNSVGL